jgi:histidinol-phosphate phosphatase family protein
MTASHKAVFLDRDGTIAKNVHYCRRVEDFEILPHVPEAIRLLNQEGYKVVVITNQSGIARGYFTQQTLSSIHEKLTGELKKHHAFIDAIYVCPHHPDEGCQCRKPSPTLLTKAANEIDLALDQSYMIGDDPKDVRAGKAAGCRTVWLSTDRNHLADDPVVPCDHTAPDLFEAIRWLLEDARAQSPRRAPIEKGSRLP